MVLHIYFEYAFGFYHFSFTPWFDVKMLNAYFMTILNLDGKLDARAKAILSMKHIILISIPNKGNTFQVINFDSPVSIAMQSDITMSNKNLEYLLLCYWIGVNSSVLLLWSILVYFTDSSVYFFYKLSLFLFFYYHTLHVKYFVFCSISLLWMHFKL